MIFDTHTHYDDEQFDIDRDELLLGLAGQGVGAVVNMGASMRGAKDSVELARKYPFVYAAVGIHPDHAKDLNEEEFSVLKALAAEEKVVAIGEIGLDYYWDSTEREEQRVWFRRQLSLAGELTLPVVIHSREAAADTLEIMKEAYEASGNTLTGVIHCFSYGVEMAREYLKMGFFLGIGGVATFKNGRKLKEVIEAVPLDKIVLETDCPYLAPEPFRGKRNSSEKLAYVVRAIAAIKGVTEEEVEKVTWENAKRLYPRVTVE
ncbi:MAG: TatD family hydrolase [Lachnospiraceae bacterium]|nr:TatD family hydrolase [Lachnospiraceae bacterium]